jgi:putative transposase
VVRVLEEVTTQRGLPQTIIMDNGPELASRVLDQWAYQHGVKLRFIEPGKPVQNAFIESLNGRFRDECLHQHWFVNLSHVVAPSRRGGWTAIGLAPTARWAI